MKTLTKIIALLSAFLLLAAGPALAGKKDPVAVLSQAQGTVEYQKPEGKKFKQIRRNKFLFDGYIVRSGADGSAKITNKITGESFEMGANTELQITSNAIVASKGSLNKVSGSELAASLMKRFDKSQSYTTVRRSHKKKVIEIDAAKSVVLTDAYPYMVWESLGSDYSYKLSIGNKSYDVAASDKELVRIKVDAFEGTQAYKIDAYQNGKKVVAMKPIKSRGEQHDRTVTWLSGSDKNNLESSVAALQQEYPENLFMLGNYYEDQNLYVAAMDMYKQYLSENPDEVEMTPYLFRVYKRLKLDKIYKDELEEYKQSLLE